MSLFSKMFGGSTNRLSTTVYSVNRKAGAFLDRKSYTPFKGYNSSMRGMYPKRKQ